MSKAVPSHCQATVATAMIRKQHHHLPDCNARGTDTYCAAKHRNGRKKKRVLVSAHLRLLSLRGSSRVRTRTCPFSPIPKAFGGSVTRTSRTVGGLDPFPNLKKENTPRFTVCDDGIDWGRSGRDIFADVARLRSTCPCRPPFGRANAVEGALSVALASGLGMTRRFGTCRGPGFDDVRDDEDETDAACPAYTGTPFIAAAVWDGGSYRRGESWSGALGGALRGPRLRPCRL